MITEATHLVERETTLKLLLHSAVGVVDQERAVGEELTAAAGSPAHRERWTAPAVHGNVGRCCCAEAGGS